MQRIGAAELRDLLQGTDELALLDVRERGTYSTNHLLHAVNLARSRVELRLEDLVPRRATPIVLCDDNSGIAEQVGETISTLGWTDVSVLDGGIDGWTDAGGELYSGVNVPSKLFGELVERHYGTPHVSPSELAQWQAEGRDLVILDSRTEREYRKMSIPGGQACPGAELTHRVFGLVDNDQTTVVVNCAGRTRSILGAQSLRRAGLSNPVVALENGTMGWELAGLELDHGAADFAARPDAEARAAGARAATAVREEFGVRVIDEVLAAEWLADGERTTFLLDVRTPEEFESSAVPGSVNAPGGQLVQATDEYVGVRNARIILIDDDKTRASMTASWLRQLGWGDTVVLEGPATWDALSNRSDPIIKPVVADIKPEELVDIPGALIVDLSLSTDHARAHVPGALWCVRGRLAEIARSESNPAVVVLTSRDGTLAAFAHGEASAAWPGAEVRVLRGGTGAWSGAGMDVETGLVAPTTSVDDVWELPYDPGDAEVARRSMERYLSWEVDLLIQHDRDDLAVFDIS